MFRAGPPHAHPGESIRGIIIVRKHECSVEIDGPPERVFQALVTPGAICAWWSASRAIVIPRQGGGWAAAWGDSEDNPDYITTAVIEACEPPRRLVLGRYAYYAGAGDLPFEADFRTEFRIAPAGHGSELRVVQEGFPDGREGDDFYAACEAGWRTTLDSLKKYIESGREASSCLQRDGRV